MSSSPEDDRAGAESQIETMQDKSENNMSRCNALKIGYEEERMKTLYQGICEPVLNIKEG